MENETCRVLVINPGSTSTKMGVYRRDGAEFVRTISHADEEVERFKGQPMVARLEYRADLIEGALREGGFGPDYAFAAVAGRGGLLPPMECGTYLVDDAMVGELHRARRGEHASNLGALLALRFAQAAGVNAYIVDPVTVDEWQECARLTGSPLVERTCIGHVLNTKAVARRYAREHETEYEALRLIVVHMGSGITVSAHAGGRMIDSNSIEDGPFGPDRTGSLPVRGLVKVAFSGQFTLEQLDRHVFGDGGLFAYLGTRDLKEVERLIESGDKKAACVLEAMIYQIAKEIGAMGAVLEGNADAVILSGGMAHSARVVNGLRRFVGWIAPVTAYPGEDELRALAEGVFRVLDGEEQAKRMSAGG